MQAQSRTVRVKVLSQYNPKKVVLNAFSNDYSSSLADEKIIKVSEGDVVVINAIGDICSISKNGEIIGSFKEVMLSSLADHPYFKLQI